MIVAIVACYNSAETIVPCLESLNGKVDLILCFDAKWHGFPYPSLYSDDKTEFLINCLNSSWLPIQYIKLPSPIDQVRMRSVMVGSVPEGNWILNIDADEIITHWDGDIKAILESTKENGFRVCQKYQKERCATTTLRLVKKTQGLHYTNDHREVEDNNGVIDVHRFPVLTNIVIDHHELAANKRMRPYMEEYKKWLLKYENEHRKT